MPSTNKLNIYTTSKGIIIKLRDHPKVWNPYSAVHLLNVIESHNLERFVKDGTVLDLGTGTGILAIWAAKNEAKKVYMTDFNSEAVLASRENAKINKVENKCETIFSDRFQQLGKQKFDFIISNPPVQPWLLTDEDHLTDRLNAIAWNEAGNKGRLVLDTVISKGVNYLTERGIVIFDHSSRHNLELTEKALNKYWGMNNWCHIGKFVYEIDYPYHGPYLSKWKDFQRKDKNLRIFNEKQIEEEFNNDTKLISKIEIPLNIKSTQKRLFYKYIITVASKTSLDKFGL